jgi:hypothetical protein
MNLKEEINKVKGTGNFCNCMDYEDAIRIAEAYAKEKAHDAYWEATRSSFRFAKEPVVLSKQDVDVDFEKWWEDNK